MSKNVSKQLLLAWPTQTMSFAVASVILGYATFYATDYMGINPGLVGILFMVSKIFDGFTDIVAGFLIDKTHTKMGKARPYALASLGYWLSIILLFSAPEMSNHAGAIYLFVCYTMINSVFLTLTQCSESVYLANAMDDTSQSVTILAVGNLISLVFTLAASIIIPQLIKTIGTTREGWRIIVLAIGVPFAIVGLIRFLVVKEVREYANIDTVRIRDMVSLLAKNKYILLFSLIIVLANVGYYLVATVGTYYYQYIMGDIGLQAQSVEANNMIISLNSIVPAVLCGIQLFLLKYYDLDGLLPRIRNELRLR